MGLLKLSLTVKVTVIGAPTLAQVKKDELTDREPIPDASLEPLSTWAAVKVLVPAAFKYKLTFCVTTVGPVLSMVYVSPTNGKVVLIVGFIPVELARFSVISPLPVPVFTVKV